MARVRRKRMLSSDGGLPPRTAIVNDPQSRIIRDKRCVACGERFACYAGGCWCDALSLTAETQARLLAQYTDCLCPTCLRQASLEEVPGPECQFRKDC